MFKDYKSYIALDPHEWPGDWEEIIRDFPELAKCKMKCMEGQKVIDSIPILADVKDDFVNFLSKLYKLNMKAPMGGIVFLDENKNIFRTNWELSECWEWSCILERFNAQDCYMHYFSATGAEFEIKRDNHNVRLQHLDHEHPDGIDGSRSDLPGVILEKEDMFTSEVKLVLQFLNDLRKLSEEREILSAFQYVFGGMTE